MFCRPRDFLRWYILAPLFLPFFLALVHEALERAERSGYNYGFASSIDRSGRKTIEAFVTKDDVCYSVSAPCMGPFELKVQAVAVPELRGCSGFPMPGQ